MLASICGSFTEEPTGKTKNGLSRGKITFTTPLQIFKLEANLVTNNITSQSYHRITQCAQSYQIICSKLRFVPPTCIQTNIFIFYICLVLFFYFTPIYMYCTRGLLFCLFGFGDLGQNPAGTIIISTLSGKPLLNIFLSTKSQPTWCG